MENIQGSKRKILGTCKKTGESIYFYKPTWDCDWYWGFGYLGNKNQHYHLSDYANGRNINMYDALIGDYDLIMRISKYAIAKSFDETLIFYRVHNIF